MASNSKKAKADRIDIDISEDQKYVYLSFTDNGVGLDPNIDVNELFGYGVSSNSIKKGFGIGLNQILELAEEMGGTAKIDEKYSDGFRLEVSIRK